jgi:hypothetical protein
MAQHLGQRTDKWDYMKLKSFCATKEMISKLKMLSMEWEKIFASYTSDKGTYYQIIQGAQKTKHPI